MMRYINDQIIAAIRTVRNLFLPAWYLPRGTIKVAKESQLELASSSCEKWGIWCGVLVVVSVAAEFIISFWINPPYAAFLTDSAWTDAGIAIGVIGEVGFGMWDSRIQTELRKRSNDRVAEAEGVATIAVMQSATANADAAGAITRAAKLEIEATEARARTAEIERLTAWRHVSPEQASQIIVAIRDKAPTFSVFIEHQRGDPEAWSYSMELMNVFRDAGVGKMTTGPNSFMGVVFGLLLRIAPEIDRESIETAFKHAGIQIWVLEENAAIHLLSSSIRAFGLYVFVGPKPPPTAATNPAQRTSPKRE